jgi:hypothetical protein
MEEHDDDELFAIDEGNESLREYAENLTDAEKEQFLARLKDDEAFASDMRDALDEINNLFTLAAVGDEDDFEEAREEILNDTDNPEASVHSLRMFYLENTEEIDMSALLSNSDDELQYEKRLQETLAGYSEKHSS